MTSQVAGEAGPGGSHVVTNPSGATESKPDGMAIAWREVKPAKRHDMTWHDHLIMLLHEGASIEHALMVQYLYAAYSLGGEQVAEEDRPLVQEWQNTILAVAREEMGHLLTVQNILTLLGAGVNLSRENFPWDIAYYPFPFNLEQFTIESLACYVYAEMPVEELFEERKEIEALARRHEGKGATLHPVGEIYDFIIRLIGDTELIPDSAFQEESIRIQASWDDWGRGYKPDPRALDPEGNLLDVSRKAQKAAQFRAHVMVDQVATRTEALQALIALSVQGEGPNATETEDEWSHFQRFIKIYREFKAKRTEKREGWSPSRPVAKNPATVRNSQVAGQSFISASQSQDWAELFNLRYRMLLTLLSHTFQLARVTRQDEPSERAVLMHRAFAEMYNLKTIAGILVQLPLTDDPTDERRAGPPFEMPFSLRLPPSKSDIWCLHLDLLKSSGSICQEILAHIPPSENTVYIKTLRDLDIQTAKSIEKILAGMGSTERY